MRTNHPGNNNPLLRFEQRHRPDHHYILRTQPILQQNLKFFDFAPFVKHSKSTKNYFRAKTLRKDATLQIGVARFIPDDMSVSGSAPPVFVPPTLHHRIPACGGHIVDTDGTAIAIRRGGYHHPAKAWPLSLPMVTVTVEAQLPAFRLVKVDGLFIRPPGDQHDQD